MTKVSTKNLTKELTKSMKKTLSNTSIRAIAISLLFIFSGIGASVLINPASAAPNVAAPSAAAPSAAAPVAAATPLTQAQANWEFPNGNAFDQDYNPQSQINSSNVQNLGLSWIFPLPTKPTSLNSLSGLGGVRRRHGDNHRQRHGLRDDWLRRDDSLQRRQRRRTMDLPHTPRAQPDRRGVNRPGPAPRPRRQRVVLDGDLRQRRLRSNVVVPRAKTTTSMPSTL